MQEQGWVVQCNQCGLMVDTGFVQRREGVINVQTLEVWWKFRPYRYVHSGLVNLCPDCATGHDAAQQVQRQKRLLLVGSTGLGFFSWVYLGTTGLVGALAVILIGAFYRWRARTSLPQIRGNL